MLFQAVVDTQYWNLFIIDALVRLWERRQSGSSHTLIDGSFLAPTDNSLTGDSESHCL